MSGATFCRCDAPHVERVELSPLHILGPGIFWQAAKPGGTYLTGHGNHFYTEDDAREYAFGTHRSGQRLEGKPCPTGGGKHGGGSLCVREDYPDATNHLEEDKMGAYDTLSAIQSRLMEDENEYNGDIVDQSVRDRRYLLRLIQEQYVKLDAIRMIADRLEASPQVKDHEIAQDLHTALEAS